MRQCQLDEAILKDTSFYKSDLCGAGLQGLAPENAAFQGAKPDLQQCVWIAEYVTGGHYEPERVPQNGKMKRQSEK